MYVLINKSGLSVLDKINRILEETSEYISVLIPEGLENSILKVTESEGIYTITEDTVAMTASDKAARIAALWAACNLELYTAMGTLFNTSNFDAAITDEKQFQLMIASPSSFSAGGFLADKTIGAFTIGDALNTDQKVTDFATARMAEINTFLVWRLGKVQTCALAVAAIEAE